MYLTVITNGEFERFLLARDMLFKKIQYKLITNNICPNIMLNAQLESPLFLVKAEK